MLDSWLALPQFVQYAILFLIGIVVGALLNWLSDLLGWHRRYRSPWSRIPEKEMQKVLHIRRIKKSPKKKWIDFVPLVGWRSFARFSIVLGRRFWVRPFCVELIFGVGLPLLYYWEVVSQNLSILIFNIQPEATSILVTRFVLHVLFFSFLAVATLTDFDDLVISDLITVPGTVFGLLVGALMSWGQLPATEIVPPSTNEQNIATQSTSGLVKTPYEGLYYRNTNLPLHVASPKTTPSELMGRPNFLALGVGLACWWGWCFAMMNRVWRMNFGLKQALTLFFRRLIRSQSTWYYLLAGLAGSLVIVILWNGVERWQGGFAALVGMAVGGSIIWLVRIAGAICLRVESMGFGDVAFMAMIGAFLGWQPCIFIFFLAPIIGLSIVIILWFLGLWQGNMLPYGPSLALGTLFAVIFWRPFWIWAEPMFEMGWLIPLMMLICGVLLFVLLAILRVIKQQIGMA